MVNMCGVGGMQRAAAVSVPTVHLRFNPELKVADLGYGIFLVILTVVSTAAGYGERTDTLPNWQERAVAVLTNACRTAPQTFRDRFVGSDNILLPESYPAVPPLYRNRSLNAAARFHTVEMALDCGMTHTCNGVTFEQRLAEFYSGGGYIGENIASGYSTPQDVVNGWLIDGSSVESAAPDGDGDGHRANIMSRRFRETGCGYYPTGTGRTAKLYWCQDFGSGKSLYTYHPVTSASHLFLEKSRITFMAVVYDTAKTVSSLSLILDGSRMPMTLAMGTAAAGTWEVSSTTASGCRSYFFETVFSDGSTIKYPENEMLVTVGEGTCKEGDTTERIICPKKAGRFSEKPISIHLVGDHLVFSAGRQLPKPLQTVILNSQGRVVARATWHGLTITLPAGVLPSGIWLFRHSFTDNTFSTGRWFKP